MADKTIHAIVEHLPVAIGHWVKFEDGVEMEIVLIEGDGKLVLVLGRYNRIVGRVLYFLVSLAHRIKAVFIWKDADNA